MGGGEINGEIIHWNIFLFNFTMHGMGGDDTDSGYTTSANEHMKVS